MRLTHQLECPGFTLAGGERALLSSEPARGQMGPGTQGQTRGHSKQTDLNSRIPGVDSAPPFEEWRRIVSAFQPPRGLRNAHLQTILPLVSRRNRRTEWDENSVRLTGGRKLNLFWSRSNHASRVLVVLCRGLEGDAQSHYMQAAAKGVNSAGVDALAWQMDVETGDDLGWGQASATQDLHSVLQIVLRDGWYRSVLLVGFSLGANLIQLYLGRDKHMVPKQVTGFISVSCPCDLEGSQRMLEQSGNTLYRRYLMASVKKRIRARLGSTFAVGRFSDAFRVCSPDGEEGTDYNRFWKKNSSKHYLSRIEVPGLVLSAKDDSFLSDSCYPYSEASTNRSLYLLVTQHGGHLGFQEPGAPPLYVSLMLSWIRKMDSSTQNKSCKCA